MVEEKRRGCSKDAKRMLKIRTVDERWMINLSTRISRDEICCTNTRTSNGRAGVEYRPARSHLSKAFQS
jgi:hypothetical protein